MFKVKYEVCSYLNAIPLGVTHMNTLICNLFKKMCLVFSLNNVRDDHKKNMFINILTQ